MSNTKEKFILAIDHGTSGVKTALMTPAGESAGYEFEQTPVYFTEDSGAEQNPDDWWKAIVSTTRRLLQRTSIHPDSIIAVACSSTFSSTVIVDKNGELLMNSLTWLDSRGAPYVKSAMKGWINIQGYGFANILRWLPKTGGAPGLSGKDDMGHVLFVKNKFPEIYKNAFMFLSSKDYLNLKLTGLPSASQDSIALFWIADIRDINNVRYDERLIQRLGLEKDKFPPIKKSIDILGTLTEKSAKELGLRRDTKVIVGSADLQSACIGSGAVRDYEAHIYIGTSSWILCHVPFKKTDIFHIITSLPSAIPGKYFCANEQDTAGGALNFMLNNLFFRKDELNTSSVPDDIYERVEKLVLNVPAGSNNVIFLPWLNGEKTPVEDPELRGGFLNLSLKTTRAELMKAVMEGVAYNNRWVLKYVEKFISRKIEELNIIGGGARSDIWCQVLADVLGRKIKRVENPVLGNARGACFIAGVGLGIIKFEEIPSLIKYDKIFYPAEDNSKIYDLLFREFLNIYKKNKKIFHRLNKK